MKTYTWKYDMLGPGDPKWQQERFRTLYTVMLMATYEEKCGDCIFIVSPKVAVMLQSLPEFNYDASSKNLSRKESFVGTLNNFEVFRDNNFMKDKDFVKCYHNRKAKLAKLLDKNDESLFATIEVIMEK